MSFVGSQKIQLVSRAAGSRGADGRYVPGSESTQTICATVNPITGEQLYVMPEGERTGHNIKIITNAPVAMTTDYTQLIGDYIIWEGHRYEIRECRKYLKIIPHVEIRARRVDQ